MCVPDFCHICLHCIFIANCYLIYFRSQHLMTMDVTPCNGCCYDDVNSEVDRLLMLLSMPYDHTYLVDHTCDTVPGICEMLLPDSSHSSDVTLVLELIDLLPEVCPSKELFIILLEQMDTFKDNEIFFALLPPLGVCIQKLPSKKHLSLAAALETLSAHITTLPTPNEPSECIVSLPSGFGIVEQRLAKAISALLDFITPFVNEVLQFCVSKRCQPSAARQILDISRCLLGLLSEPLSRINLCESVQEGDSSKTPCRECAERCVSLLVRLQPDIMKLIADAIEHKEVVDRQRNESMQNRQHASGDLAADEVEELYNVEQPLPVIGLAVLLYLVHSEKICNNSIPQVYQHSYLLEFNLHLVETLLTGRAVAVIHKGIILGTSLFTDVCIKSLSGSMFEHPKMLSLLEAVVAAMTSSRVKEVSQSAIRLLHTILKAFSVTGRSRLLEFLFVSCSNENIRGHAVSLLKDEIDEALSSGETSSFLAGNSLNHLLLKVFEPLPGGYRSNLLTSVSNRVMAALNLLRYLVIRDPRKENSTGIWDLLSHIEEKFLQPLRTGIMLCHTDVNAEIEKLKCVEHMSTGKQDADDRDKVVEFNIGDKCMPDLTAEQQKDAMHSALVSLDMMESVLCRVEQLINVQP